jgi:dipeptidyl aminopeptidase/acylaminoacyl peptidase
MAEGWVGVWDLNIGELVRDFSMIGVTPTAMAVSPAGKYAVIAMHKKCGLFGWQSQSRIYTWDLTSGRVKQLQETGARAITSLGFMPDSDSVCSCDDRGEIRVWSVSSRQMLCGFRTGRAITRFSPDGRIAATGTSGGRIRLWDMATGKVVRELKGKGMFGLPTRANPTGVNDLAFSRDGRRLVSCSGSYVFNAHKNDAIYGAVIGGPVGWLYGKATKSMGERQAITRHRRSTSLRCWDVQTGDEITDLSTVVDHHEAGITNVDISADGTRALTASWDGSTRYWDLERGVQICRIAAVDASDIVDQPVLVLSPPITKVAFSANSSQALFLTREGNAIHLRNLPDRQSP